MSRQSSISVRSYVLYIIIKSTKVLFFLLRAATTDSTRACGCLSVAVFLSEICFISLIINIASRALSSIEYPLRRDCPLGADITNQMRVRGESCVLIAAADGSAARSYTYPVCLGNERGAEDVRAGVNPNQFYVPCLRDDYRSMS